MDKRKLLASRPLDFLKILATGQIIPELKELNIKITRLEESFRIRRECVKGKSLVSIVVPTKNEALYLPSLLKSLKLGTYRPIEIIVVDYSSTDRTVEIAQNLGVKVINVRRKGIGYATHIGVLQSSGEIVIRTDADALIPPDAILNAVEVFRQNSDVKLFHGGHFYRDASLLENLLPYLYDKYWRDQWKVTGYFLAFKREIYERIGGFDVNKIVDEDFDFGEKAFKKFQIRYDPNKSIFVSSRRIRNTGSLNYLLGRRRY